MLSEQSKNWLFEEWGTINPIRIDSQTAWTILKTTACKQEAQDVWNEYAQAKKLPEYLEARKTIGSYDELVSLVYIKRLRY
jgi:hypothetical protein